MSDRRWIFVPAGGPCVGVSITLDDTLPDTASGRSYAGAINASGSVGPYTFLLGTGALPPGLTLNGDGTITGTVS